MVLENCISMTARRKSAYTLSSIKKEQGNGNGGKFLSLALSRSKEYGGMKRYLLV